MVAAQKTSVNIYTDVNRLKIKKETEFSSNYVKPVLDALRVVMPPPPPTEALKLKNYLTFVHYLDETPEENSNKTPGVLRNMKFWTIHNSPMQHVMTKQRKSKMVTEDDFLQIALFLRDTCREILCPHFCWDFKERPKNWIINCLRITANIESAMTPDERKKCIERITQATITQIEQRESQGQLPLTPDGKRFTETDKYEQFLKFLTAESDEIPEMGLLHQRPFWNMYLNDIPKVSNKEDIVADMIVDACAPVFDPEFRWSSKNRNRAGWMLANLNTVVQVFKSIATECMSQ